jgi:hypothetical protein
MSSLQCVATTISGSRCKRNAEFNSQYCWQHKQIKNINKNNLNLENELELITLSYLSLEEALASSKGNINLQKQLVKRYYGDHESLILLAYMDKVDLVQFLIQNGIKLEPDDTDIEQILLNDNIGLFRMLNLRLEVLDAKEVKYMNKITSNFIQEYIQDDINNYTLSDSLRTILHYDMLPISENDTYNLIIKVIGFSSLNILKYLFKLGYNKTSIVMLAISYTLNNFYIFEFMFKNCDIVNFDTSIVSDDKKIKNCDTSIVSDKKIKNCDTSIVSDDKKVKNCGTSIISDDKKIKNCDTSIVDNKKINLNCYKKLQMYINLKSLDFFIYLNNLSVQFLTFLFQIGILSPDTLTNIGTAIIETDNVELLSFWIKTQKFNSNILFQAVDDDSEKIVKFLVKNKYSVYDLDSLDKYLAYRHDKNDFINKLNKYIVN